MSPSLDNSLLDEIESIVNKISKNPKKLTVIEQDQRFIPLLEEIEFAYPDQLEIVHDDALKIKESEIFGNKRFKIIANLHYNIGTVLIFKWLGDIKNIESMTLLLQKEVVQRITAKPGSKRYGRLSVMINFLCQKQYF